MPRDSLGGGPPSELCSRDQVPDQVPGSTVKESEVPTKYHPRQWMEQDPQEIVRAIRAKRFSRLARDLSDLYR